MPVIYNSKKLIPAPFVSISKSYDVADDGTILGKTYNIEVKGKFVAWMGSPNAAGVLWDQSGYPPDDTFNADGLLKSILRKQDAVRKLFADQGKVFEIQPLDGSASMKCNPRVLRVEVPDGHWATNPTDYTVFLEASSLEINGAEDEADIEDYKITKASDEWGIEILDEKLNTYRLTHTASAIGKRFFESDGSESASPWENAREYVLSKIGLGLKASRMVAADVLDANTLQAFNYLRSQTLNELTGAFAVTETWLCYDPQGGAAAYDEFQVSTRTSLEGRTSVGVSGNITGLAQYNNTTRVLTISRWTNASAKWTSIGSSLLTRAQTISGVTLNPTALQTQVGSNQVAGTVSYDYEYDDRPTATISGARSEHIFQDDDNAADVFAKIPVMQQPIGPVMQDIGSKTEKHRTISITAQMPAKTMSYTPTRPSTSSILASYIPTGTHSAVFVSRDQEHWDPYTGQYSRNTTWEYT